MSLPLDNLSYEEWPALEELKTGKEVLVTKSDKGDTVIILYLNDYRIESERYLTDKTFCQKVFKDLP